MIIKTLLTVVLQELGTAEIAGPEDNSRILEYAHSIGQKWVDSDSTVPWCGFLVGWCMKEMSFDLPPLPGLAKDYLNVHKYSGAVLTTDPVPGNTLVVFHRGPVDGTQGHVGVYCGHSKDGKYVFSAGGNQGNKVSIAKYKNDIVAGYVLVGVATESVSAPPAGLFRGSPRKEHIKSLQLALNTVGYETGRPDGDYGNKTEGAIIRMQKEYKLAPYDGNYGEPERQQLERLLMA